MGGRRAVRAGEELCALKKIGGGAFHLKAATISPHGFVLVFKQPVITEGDALWALSFPQVGSCKFTGWLSYGNKEQGNRQVAASPSGRYVSCRFCLLALSFDFEGLSPPCSSCSLASAHSTQSLKTSPTLAQSHWWLVACMPRS